MITLNYEETFKKTIRGVKFDLTVGDMIENIQSWYSGDTQETNWYRDRAHTEALQAVENNNSLSLRQTCALIAVFSINSTWAQNIKTLHKFIKPDVLQHYTTKDDNGNYPKGLHTTAVMNKARAVCALTSTATDEDFCKALGGSGKIQNFYLNILYPLTSDGVTLDRWALRVAFTHSEDSTPPTIAQATLSIKQYDIVAECYRQVARELGILPLSLQAATWCKLRGSAE